MIVLNRDMDIPDKTEDWRRARYKVWVGMSEYVVVTIYHWECGNDIMVGL